jgi:hypothetical protein
LLVVPQPASRDTPALDHVVAARREGERDTRLFWATCRADNDAATLMAAAQATGLPPTEAKATIAFAIQTSSKAGRA